MFGFKTVKTIAWLLTIGSSKQYNIKNMKLRSLKQCEQLKRKICALLLKIQYFKSLKPLQNVSETVELLYIPNTLDSTICVGENLANLWLFQGKIGKSVIFKTEFYCIVLFQLVKILYRGGSLGRVKEYN